MKMNEYEELVCGLINGMWLGGRPSDILSPSGEILEVKGAKLKCHGRSVEGSWIWGRLLGDGAAPIRYDRLILVGRPDWSEPLKPGCIASRDYFFDLPYDWALEYARENRNRTLRVACHRVYSSLGRKLHSDYLCDETELKRRYGREKR